MNFGTSPPSKNKVTRNKVKMMETKARPRFDKKYPVIVVQMRLLVRSDHGYEDRIGKTAR